MDQHEIDFTQFLPMTPPPILLQDCKVYLRTPPPRPVPRCSSLPYASLDLARRICVNKYIHTYVYTYNVAALLKQPRCLTTLVLRGCSLSVTATSIILPRIQDRLATVMTLCLARNGLGGAGKARFVKQKLPHVCVGWGVNTSRWKGGEGGGNIPRTIWRSTGQHGRVPLNIVA